MLSLLYIQVILSGLKELCHLDASDNSIKEVGSDIGVCLPLESLRLSSNQLSVRTVFCNPATLNM